MYKSETLYFHTPKKSTALGACIIVGCSIIDAKMFTNYLRVVLDGYRNFGLLPTLIGRAPRDDCWTREESGLPATKCPSGDGHPDQNWGKLGILSSTIFRLEDD